LSWAPFGLAQAAEGVFQILGGEAGQPGKWKDRHRGSQRLEHTSRGCPSSRGCTIQNVLY